MIRGMLLTGAPHYWMQADDDPFIPDCIRNVRMTLQSFATTILQREKDPLQYWYANLPNGRHTGFHTLCQKADPLHFEAAGGLDLLQCVNRLPTEMGNVTPAPADVVPWLIPALRIQYMVYLKLMTTKSGVNEPEWKQALTAMPVWLKQPHAEDSIVVPLSSAPLESTPMDESDDSPPTLSTSAGVGPPHPRAPAAAASSIQRQDSFAPALPSLIQLCKQECVHVMFAAACYVIEDKIPGCTIDSVLVVDRTHSLTNPIPLDIALSRRGVRLTDSPPIRGTTVMASAYKTPVRSIPQWIEAIERWVHVCLNEENPCSQRICDEILLRFRFPRCLDALHQHTPTVAPAAVTAAASSSAAASSLWSPSSTVHRQMSRRQYALQRCQTDMAHFHAHRLLYCLTLTDTVDVGFHPFQIVLNNSKVRAATEAVATAAEATTTRAHEAAPMSTETSVEPDAPAPRVILPGLVIGPTIATDHYDIFLPPPTGSKGLMVSSLAIANHLSKTPYWSRNGVSASSSSSSSSSAFPSS